MTLEWCYQKVWFTTAEDIPESYLQQEVSGVPDLIWETGCPFEVLLKAFVELCSQRNLFYLKTLQVPVQLASLAEIFLKYILTFNFVRLFVNPTCSPVENFMQLLEETCNKQCVSGLNWTSLSYRPADPARQILVLIKASTQPVSLSFAMTEGGLSLSKEQFSVQKAEVLGRNHGLFCGFAECLFSITIWETGDWNKHSIVTGIQQFVFVGNMCTYPWKRVKISCAL